MPWKPKHSSNYLARTASRRKAVVKTRRPNPPHRLDDLRSPFQREATRQTNSKPRRELFRRIETDVLHRRTHPSCRRKRQVILPLGCEAGAKPSVSLRQSAPFHLQTAESFLPVRYLCALHHRRAPKPRLKPMTVTCPYKDNTVEARRIRSFG